MGTGLTRMGENSKGSAKRRPRGKPFPKGKTGNPAGRPKQDFDLVTRCRELTPAIIERYGAMGARATNGAEVLAGKIVVEYGHDKPRQRHEVTGPDGTPLNPARVVLMLPPNGRDVPPSEK